MVTAQLSAQILAQTKVAVNGAVLYYIERGQGEPLILLHGGVGDYDSWAAQVDAFSRHYRVISYSRRYNYPNENPTGAGTYSAYVDAEDLLAFMRGLRLDHVHLVGVSAGALAALVFALQHPAMVKSLVLAEPPLHAWAKDVPGGKVLYEEFMADVWKPATNAFQQGDTLQAMRIFVDGLSAAGRFDQLPPAARATILRNARAIGALTESSEPFPYWPKNKVRKLRVPSLIVTGENTIRIHKLDNAELLRLLPNAKAVVIPNAGHGSPRDNPQEFNEKVLGFLSGVRK